MARKLVKLNWNGWRDDRHAEDYGTVGHVEGDKIIIEECVIREYYGYEYFFDGMEPIYIIGEEAFEEAWEREYKGQAEYLLRQQLISDFDDEVLDNVEIHKERYKDGFSLDDAEMFVDIAFDKKYMEEKWLEIKPWGD